MADIKVWLIICMFVLYLICRGTENYFRSHPICYISSYMSNSTEGGGGGGGIQVSGPSVIISRKKRI